MNKASFTVEIDAKPNTQEYSDKMFSAMAECMKEITKDLYDSDKRITEYLVRRTNGDGFKVVEVEHISPRYMTISTRKYCKTREQAEKYRNALVSNSKGSPSENSFNRNLQVTPSASPKEAELPSVNSDIIINFGDDTNGKI